MTEPTVGEVSRAYAVAGMAGAISAFLGLFSWFVLLPLTEHEDPIAGPETIASPMVWIGFGVVLGAFWVAVEWWLPRSAYRRSLVMAGLSAAIGVGYLVGDSSGASTVALRLQGLLFVAPAGLVMPWILGWFDRTFATLRWWWMAGIAGLQFAASLAVLVLLAERIGNVPVVYPITTGLLFSALTVVRWSRSEDEAQGSPVVRRLAVSLVVAMALVGLVTGLFAM